MALCLRSAMDKIYKILTVDDEAGFTRMMRRNLEMSGRFEVRELNDPTQTIPTALDYRPDVILLDVVMPKMDGGDVAAKLSNHPLLRKTPVLMLTALIDRNEVGDAGVRQGTLRFLPKPVSVETLLECLEDMLGQ